MADEGKDIATKNKSATRIKPPIPKKPPTPPRPASRFAPGVNKANSRTPPPLPTAAPVGSKPISLPAIPPPTLSPSSIGSISPKGGVYTKLFHQKSPTIEALTVEESSNLRGTPVNSVNDKIENGKAVMNDGMWEATNDGRDGQTAVNVAAETGSSRSSFWYVDIPDIGGTDANKGQCKDIGDHKVGVDNLCVGGVTDTVVNPQDQDPCKNVSPPVPYPRAAPKPKPKKRLSIERQKSLSQLSPESEISKNGAFGFSDIGCCSTDLESEKLVDDVRAGSKDADVNISPNNDDAITSKVDLLQESKASDFDVVSDSVDQTVNHEDSGDSLIEGGSTLANIKKDVKEMGTKYQQDANQLSGQEEQKVPIKPPRPKRLKTLLGLENVLHDMAQATCNVSSTRIDGDVVTFKPGLSVPFNTFECNDDVIRVRTEINQTSQITEYSRKSRSLRKSQSETALDCLTHFDEFPKEDSMELIDCPFIDRTAVEAITQESLSDEIIHDENNRATNQKSIVNDEILDVKDKPDTNNDIKAKLKLNFFKRAKRPSVPAPPPPCITKKPQNSRNPQVSSVSTNDCPVKKSSARGNYSEDELELGIVGKSKEDIELNNSGGELMTEVNASELNANDIETLGQKEGTEDVEKDNYNGNNTRSRTDSDGYFNMDQYRAVQMQAQNCDFGAGANKSMSMAKDSIVEDMDDVYVCLVYNYENQVLNDGSDRSERRSSETRVDLNIPLVDRTRKPSPAITHENLYQNENTPTFDDDIAQELPPPRIPIRMSTYTSDSLDLSTKRSRAPKKPLRLSQRVSSSVTQSETSKSKISVTKSCPESRITESMLDDDDANIFSSVPPPCPPLRNKASRDDGYIYPDPVPVSFAPDFYWQKAKTGTDRWRPVSVPALDNVDVTDGLLFKKKTHSLSFSNVLSPTRHIARHYLEKTDSGAVTSDVTESSASIREFSSSSCEEIGVSEDNEASEKRSKMFYIAEEMMTSEKTFLDVLKLLNIDLRHAITRATEVSGKPVIPTATLNMILEFLPSLQSFSEMLLRDLTDRIKNWTSDGRIADVFIRKGPFLKLASSYIRNFEASSSLLDDSRRRYAGFDLAVKEFEASPRCANLAIKHYMLKPVQRVPQYKLLLQDYLKNLPRDSEEYNKTLVALATIAEVAKHANESMKTGDAVLEMLNIQNSLIGQFEVITPGRTFLKKGELLKLSRKEMQPRMFFLFNDVLLYTTLAVGGFKFKDVFPLAGMKVNKSIKDETRCEFSVISVKRSFFLAASTPDEREAWVDALNNAIIENLQRRSTFEGDHARVTSESGLAGEKAPPWIPDSRVTMCSLCTCEFSLTWRRHHCRCCGQVVCTDCSGNKAPLKYLKYKTARVCNMCYTKLKNDFDEREKTLPWETTVPDSDGVNLAGLRERFTQIRRSFGKSGKRRPAVLKEVHANDTELTANGYLRQQKGKRWKKFWFVIKDYVLYTYKASEDMAATESLPLLGYTVTPIDGWYEGIEPGLVFQLVHANTEPVVFRADTTEAASRWIEWINDAANPS